MDAMRPNLLVVAILLSALLGACGQQQQHTAIHQGKADPAPWDSPEGGGAQAAWERSIEARTANQNEDGRMR
jgi:hypothetical protein